MTPTFIWALAGNMVAVSSAAAAIVLNTTRSFLAGLADLRRRATELAGSMM
jgi:hypothetical protein